MSDSPRHKPTLSASQVLALDALLAGETGGEAAKRAGVTRQTVSKWRHEEGPFREALEESQEEIRSELVQDRIRGARIGFEALIRAARSDGPGAVQAATVLVRSVVGEQLEHRIARADLSGVSDTDLDRIRAILAGGTTE